MQNNKPTESDLSELVEAALAVIKHHDKGSLQHSQSFDSNVIGKLRAMLIKLFNAGTRCFKTSKYTYFTHDGRKVLIFGADGDHHLISPENWTVDPNDCVPVGVELATVQFTKAQIDVLRQWCSEIP